MRDIKFRAWNKKTKTMIDLYKITPLALSASLKQDGVFIPFDEDIEIMQYTGLKDKNGVEIYEGDIVVKDEYIWRDDGKPNYNGTVEWVFSQWQVIAHCVNPEKRGVSDGINYGMNDDGVEENGISDWEIIGNLYENPELLDV